MKSVYLVEEGAGGEGDAELARQVLARSHGEHGVVDGNVLLAPLVLHDAGGGDRANAGVSECFKDVRSHTSQL
jgi:hypothetical protein